MINDTEIFATGMRAACVTGFRGSVEGAAVGAVVEGAAVAEGAAVGNVGAIFCDKVGLARDGGKVADFGRVIVAFLFFFPCF